MRTDQLLALLATILKAAGPASKTDEQYVEDAASLMKVAGGDRVQISQFVDYGRMR